jgi:tricorn protease
MDGGQAFVPQGGMGSKDGQWIIEGHGVDPDIVVENDPAAVAAGHDPQLERAVDELQKAMAAHPAALPARPPDPVKTREATAR